MPDLLAIDWEKRQLCGLDAEVTRGSVVVRRCFTLTWPEDLDPISQHQEAGQWLKDELARIGVTSKQVMVTLPTEDAVVRQLELPNAPDEELPDLVRFQAADKSIDCSVEFHGRRDCF